MKIKRFFKFVWNEFVYGGHLISLGAVSIAFISSVLLRIDITWDCLVIVYLGFQSMYSYNRYKELDQDILTNPQRSDYLKKYSKILPFLIFIYLLALFALLISYSNLKTILFSVLLLLLGFGYSWFLKKITRSVIGFKSFVVAFLWSLLVVFVTLYYSFEFGLPVFILVLFVFFRRFIITSFCDVKDIEGDKKNNMLTLPIVLNNKNFSFLLNFFNFISLVLFLLGIFWGLYPWSTYFLSFTFLIPFIYINLVDYKKKSINFISEVIVRGEFLLWPLFLMFSKIIY